MYKYLIEHYAGNRVGGWHNNQVPKNKKDYFIWTIIRNPYHRAVSIWWSAIKRDPNYRPKIREEIGSDSFNDFAIWLNKVKDNPPEVLFMSQSMWLKSVRLDAILKLEELEKDFKRLPFVKYDILELSKLNKAEDCPPNKGYGDWKQYYNKENYRLIAEWSLLDGIM